MKAKAILLGWGEQNGRDEKGSNFGLRPSTDCIFPLVAETVRIFLFLKILTF